MIGTFSGLDILITFFDVSLTPDVWNIKAEQSQLRSNQDYFSKYSNYLMLLQYSDFSIQEDIWKREYFLFL